MVYQRLEKIVAKHGLNIYEHVVKMGVFYCFDSGHALVQNDPKMLWDKMSEKVSVLHLHDNNGFSDTHQALGEGVFPWESFSEWLMKSPEVSTIGLECRFTGKSVGHFQQWLNNNFSFVKNNILKEVS